MKTSHLLDYFRRHDGETLAVFGDARLIKKLDGKLEFRGASPNDRRAEVALSFPPRGGGLVSGLSLSVQSPRKLCILLQLRTVPQKYIQ